MEMFWIKEKAMADKKPHADFEPIGDIIKATLGKWLNTAGEPITRVWEVWDAAVGETTARNAHPASLKNRLLTVQVASPVWIQQLQFSKKNLIEAINAAAGSPLVADIRFKIGN